MSLHQTSQPDNFWTREDLRDSKVPVKLILETLVGSRAHGTDGPNSDIDTRSVYMHPTSSLVSLIKPPRFKAEPGQDDNCWELDRFVELSLKSNPSTLEVLLIEPLQETEEGAELRSLFPHFLRRIAVWGSFSGFANKQERVMLSETSKRQNKAASHYLRVLYNGCELLRTGTMSVRIMDTEIGQLIMSVKNGEVSLKEVTAHAQKLREELSKAYEASRLPEEANLAPINDFLIRARKNNW